MLKALRNHRAQAVIGEYVLVFFIVAAVIAGISLFFRRALQARIRDAQIHMYKTTTNALIGTWINPGAVNSLNGLYLHAEYEPYYTLRTSDTRRQLDERRRLFGSFNASSGIFRLDIDRDETFTTVNSMQLPPALAN